MISIVITGGIGCGKSVACAYIEQQGYEILYADEIARSMTMSGGEAIDRISEVFGSEYISTDGSMDRVKMRNLVYKDKLALSKLEEITTYATKDKIDNIIRSADGEVVFIEIPLLFELKSQGDYDYSWLVTADYETRIQRIIDRDGISREQAISIIEAQMPEQDKIRLSDEVIYNNSTKEALYKQIKSLFVKYNI